MRNILFILTLLTLIVLIVVCNNFTEKKSTLDSGEKFSKIDSVIVHAIKDSAFQA